jgi:hypothetical protein
MTCPPLLHGHYPAKPFSPTINGTDILLTAAEIQAVARVMHELVTNAAKYGALSIPGGHVSVNWDSKSNGDGTNLSIVWQERDGPPVKSGIQSSYGTNLIRDLIPHELGGKVDLVLAPVPPATAARVGKSRGRDRSVCVAQLDRPTPRLSRH